MENLNTENLYTLSEASYVSGLCRELINLAIAEGRLHIVAKSRGHEYVPRAEVCAMVKRMGALTPEMLGVKGLY